MHSIKKTKCLYRPKAAPPTSVKSSPAWLSKADCIFSSEISYLVFCPRCVSDKVSSYFHSFENFVQFSHKICR